MIEKDNEFDKILLEYLEGKPVSSKGLDPYRETLEKVATLREVPTRDPDKLASARHAFLNQAKSMAVPVSKQEKRRLNGWNKIFRRERSPMTTILSFVLALVIAFGGAGTTAYAAQDSLPTEALYPIKQLTEQIRLALTTDTETEVYLLSDLTEERVGEMVALVNQGSVIPEETQLRLQEHIEMALAEAAQLGDAAMMRALQHLQVMAQNQIRSLQEVQQNRPEETTSERLRLAINAMNRFRQQAEDGLRDPGNFRLRQGENRPKDAPDQPEVIPPGNNDAIESPSHGRGAGQGNGAGIGGDGANGEGNGDGTGDGGDASRNGNGDGTGDGGGAYGNGYGDGTGDGGGAYGSGYGDGTSDGGGAYGNGYGDGTGDGGGAYGDGNGDGVCDCLCGDPACDCTLQCPPQNQQGGRN